jgi:Rieske 2Fe-2S family protein
VGRASDLGSPGAYRTIEIADESIILIRNDDGRIYAHLNFCRHRGTQLVCGSGELRGSIRCPYHGWAYRFDGTLLAAPFVDKDEIPDTARRLHRVDVDEWGGFVFVRLSANPKETLRDQLGPVPERLMRYPLSDLRTAASRSYDVNANWKVLLENYNECYHCAGVHPELCQLVPSFKAHGGAELDWERGIPHREGAVTFTHSGTTTREPFPGLNEDERVRHKGELIYPNLMLSLSADHVAAFCLWPRSPDRTTVVCDFLFHPDEMARAGFDPSDAVDFWDLVNRQDWSICERVQAGMRSPSFTHGYYAPMEDASLDIRRYIALHLGEQSIKSENG